VSPSASAFGVVDARIVSATAVERRRLAVGTRVARVVVGRVASVNMSTGVDVWRRARARRGGGRRRRAFVWAFSPR
jgi:hypothetical protein